MCDQQRWVYNVSSKSFRSHMCRPSLEIAVAVHPQSQTLSSCKALNERCCFSKQHTYGLQRLLSLKFCGLHYTMVSTICLCGWLQAACRRARYQVDIEEDGLQQSMINLGQQQVINVEAAPSNVDDATNVADEQLPPNPDADEFELD